MRSTRSLLHGILGLLLSVSGTLDATTGLAKNSPFLPPNTVTKPKATPPPPPTNRVVAQQLEFRGLIKFGGQYRFSLFDKRNQKGYWLSQNQGHDGILISSYDNRSQTVVVQFSGRTERLTLMSATDAPLPVATSNPQPSVSKPINALPPGVKNPTLSKGNQKTIPRRRVIIPTKR